MKIILCILFIFFLKLGATEYTIDKTHTKILFHITPLVFNTMNGEFDNFKETFKYDETKNILSDVDVSISSSSINSDHEKRDTHLKSKDFFFVEKLPELIFKLDKSKVNIGKEVTITGKLVVQ